MDIPLDESRAAVPSGVDVAFAGPAGEAVALARRANAVVFFAGLPPEAESDGFDREHDRWVVEAGAFDLAVGASSRDLRLATRIEVTAPPLRVRLDAMATLEEWLADPDGADAVRHAVGVEPGGAPRGILGDPELMRVLGNFPLSSLATFPGLGLDRDSVSPLVKRFAAGR